MSGCARCSGGEFGTVSGRIGMELQMKARVTHTAYFHFVVPITFYGHSSQLCEDCTVRVKERRKKRDRYGQGGEEE